MTLIAACHHGDSCIPQFSKLNPTPRPLKREDQTRLIYHANSFFLIYAQDFHNNHVLNPAVLQTQLLLLNSPIAYLLGLLVLHLRHCLSLPGKQWVFSIFSLCSHFICII